MTDEELNNLRRVFLGQEGLRNVANDPQFKNYAAMANASQTLMKDAQAAYLAMLQGSSGDTGVERAMAVAVANKIASRFLDLEQSGTGLRLKHRNVEQHWGVGGSLEGQVHSNGTTTVELKLVDLSITDLEDIIELLKPFIRTPTNWTLRKPLETNRI